MLRQVVLPDDVSRTVDRLESLSEEGWKLETQGWGANLKLHAVLAILVYIPEDRAQRAMRIYESPECIKLLDKDYLVFLSSIWALSTEALLRAIGSFSDKERRLFLSSVRERSA